MARPALEKSIEQRACSEVRKKFGVIGVKLVTPGETGYPDRLFLIHGGKPFMIEFKREGEPARRKQLYIHGKLRGLGYDVEVHDTVEGAVAAVALRVGACYGSP